MASIALQCAAIERIDISMYRSGSERLSSSASSSVTPAGTYPESAS